MRPPYGLGKVHGSARISHWNFAQLYHYRRRLAKDVIPPARGCLPWNMHYAKLSKVEEDGLSRPIQVEDLSGMRTETVADSNLVIRWRDEREGRTMLNDPMDLSAVLRHYGFGPVLATPPLAVEDNDYVLACQSEGGYPCRLTIARKAKGPVQTAAWRYARETRMALIVYQDGELGVHFLDENRFVPFVRLDYDSSSGFILQ